MLSQSKHARRASFDQAQDGPSFVEGREREVPEADRARPIPPFDKLRAG